MNSPAPETPDPFFDPPFFNDVVFVDRGWFKNIMHFAKKHREENLVHAAANHILSHLEFNACLADFAGLRSRYRRLRSLEDVDEFGQTGTGQRLVRVRFVNYYTVSTGLPKKSKQKPPGSPSKDAEQADTQKATDRLSADIDPHVATPRISIEDHDDGPQRNSLQELDPVPEPFQPLTTAQLTESTADENACADDSSTSQGLELPSIPGLPSPPEPADLDTITDKESRKQAEKAFKHVQRAYNKAVKAREKAIKVRQKALDKQHRKALKDAAKRARAVLHKDHGSPGSEGEGDDDAAEEARKKGEKRKPPRLRKFCMLPPSSTSSSSSSSPGDPTWVEVRMEGVDEVGAHCGLFVPGPHYERLVGDVGERIAGWVREDASRRAIMGL